MAVVRCPTHNVPYNDENPRGCPACWQERFGSDPSNVMRELARASKAIPHVEILPPPTEEEVPPIERLSKAWPPPVTPPPRLPTPEPTRLERLLRFVRRNATAVVGSVIVVVGAVLVWVITRPTFEPALIPPPVAEAPLPFPGRPNTPIMGLFVLLGPQTQRVNPDDARMTRYGFGTGVTVDVFNGTVYAVTLTSVARSWEGLRVGELERPARGRLALQGPIRDVEPEAAAPFPFGGYLAYRRMADLPARRLIAEVRPPNGCYDVELTIAPQVIGTATRGDESFVAIARRGAAATWVVHQVRAFSRAMRGPYGGPPVCEAETPAP